MSSCCCSCLLGMILERERERERERKGEGNSWCHTLLWPKSWRERGCVYILKVWRVGTFSPFLLFLFLIPNSTELWHLSFSFPFLLFALVVGCVSPFFFHDNNFSQCLFYRHAWRELASSSSFGVHPVWCACKKGKKVCSALSLSLFGSGHLFLLSRFKVLIENDSSSSSSSSNKSSFFTTSMLTQTHTHIHSFFDSLFRFVWCGRSFTPSLTLSHTRHLSGQYSLCLSFFRFLLPPFAVFLAHAFFFAGSPVDRRWTSCCVQQMFLRLLLLPLLYNHRRTAFFDDDSFFSSFLAIYFCTHTFLRLLRSGWQRQLAAAAAANYDEGCCHVDCLPAACFVFVVSVVGR